jgi:hypothetical protein
MNTQMLAAALLVASLAAPATAAPACPQNQAIYSISFLDSGASAATLQFEPERQDRGAGLGRHP